MSSVLGDAPGDSRGALRGGIEADVVVVGGGVAGLVVAHDLARAGVRVIVCEASDRVGGLLRRGTVAGIDVDLGAESFATRTDAVAALVADAGLDLDLVSPRPGGARLVVATPDGPVRAPLPRRTVLGIPADPTAPDVVAIIGEDAAARAAQERERSLGVLGGVAHADLEPSLFDLVVDRCGPVVAERLVDPLCRSVYSRPAGTVRLSELHPAMWQAFLAHGSLTAAAETLASANRAGAAVGGIAGGMWRLPAALAIAAGAAGAQLHSDTPVEAITDEAGTGLVVHTASGRIQARAVVIATGPTAAARLGIAAADAAGDPTPDPVAERVRVVAAAIDHAGLDVFPVGSGVLVDPALPTAAKALTHTTAKWPWARAASPSLHLVRLSARDADAGTLASAIDVAREVTLLTGIAIQASDVKDIVVQEWTDAVATQAEPARAVGAIAGVTDARGIHRTGAAVAGTGLASVIPHARALAATLIAQTTRSTA